MGKTYALRLSLFGFLPAGEHRITLVNIDRAANLIESKESGALAPVWNHTIRFQPFGDGRLCYTKWDLNRRSLGRALERALTDANLRANMLRLQALQDKVDGPANAAREIVKFLRASRPTTEVVT